MRLLEVVGGVEEKRIMGGERVTPLVDGEEAKRATLAVGGEGVEQTPPTLGGELVRRATPLVVGDQVKPSTLLVDGEQVKPTTPLVDGERSERTTPAVGTPVAVDGGATTQEAGDHPRMMQVLVDGGAAKLEAGARPRTTLVQVAVDGVPPTRTTTPLVRPSHPRKWPPRRMTHQLPLRRKIHGVLRTIPGAQQTIPGARPLTPGARQRPLRVHLVGVPPATPGPLQTKPHSLNLLVAPVPTKGRGRNWMLVLRGAVGLVGAIRPMLSAPLKVTILKLNLLCSFPKRYTHVSVFVALLVFRPRQRHPSP